MSSSINEDVIFNTNLNSDDKTNPEENMDANMHPPTSTSTLTSQDGTAEDLVILYPTQKMKEEQKNQTILGKILSREMITIFMENMLGTNQENFHLYIRHMSNTLLVMFYLKQPWGWLYDNQQIVTNKTPISTPELIAIPSPSTSDISLDSNSGSKSTYHDHQYTLAIPEPLPTALENLDSPIDRNQDSNNDSQSVLVEYLD